MKKNTLILFTSLCASQICQAQTTTEIPVPNGEFNMFKPETNYTVAATWPAGNNFARGVGDNINLAGGTINYEDGSDPGVSGDDIADLDMPGWAPLAGGNDLFNNGVDGSNGLNLFAGWGGAAGPGSVQSAEPIGVFEAGRTYTVKVLIGGPDEGPISGPLNFHLAANGIPLTPTESIDPTLPNGGAFQEISRTYDPDATADHIGEDMTIIVGLDPSNSEGNRVIFDNVTLEATAPLSEIVLDLAPSEDVEGAINFSWNAQEGKVYDLVTSTDLLSPPATWPVYDPDGEGGNDPYGDLAEISELSDVPGDGSVRFFALIEKTP